ncbi:hypothetical protein PVAND_014402 [Polypedilum vanderplanki]|uniref:Odorant-binding protein n=1 Tax=Polypedilum vanderplanki TaxID=319348 RepID=A0A9J6BA29_POLVA|nr:hypothetical protein PVAND_014402 [Polypedilum vanderplanki]
MNKFFVLFLVYWTPISTDDLLIDCSLIIKPIIHPRECCDFPLIWINDTTNARCMKECSNIKSNNEYKTENDYENDKCCFMRCLYSLQRILYKDYNDNIVRIDTNMLKTNFRKDQINRLSNEWMEIVAKSVDTCIDMYPPAYSRGHCLPIYFLNTMVCAYRENFLNCPIYGNDLERCKQLRQSVKYCRENTEVTIKDWDKFFF